MQDKKYHDFSEHRDCCKVCGADGIDVIWGCVPSACLEYLGESLFNFKILHSDIVEDTEE